MLDILTKVGPALAMVLYGVTAVAWTMKGNPGLAIMWGSYALANVGIIIASWNS